MNEIFADTAGWGHLLDSAQDYHSLASEIYRSARLRGCRFITTSYVIVELAALLHSPLHVPRPMSVDLLTRLKTSPWVEIIHVDAGLDEQGWQLFSQRLDKSWSLVDCVSFIVMRQYGISEALTTDHHFEQAGFLPLLK